MTKARLDGEGSPFGEWIRHHPGLDSIRERLSMTDSDLWIHKYAAHRDRVGSRAIDSLMLVEVKCHSKDIEYAQRDTLRIVSGLLRAASVRKDGRRRFVRVPGTRTGERRIARCFGVHLLQMSATRPDNSRRMLWDGKVIDIDTLVEVLRFERDPDHPRKFLEERRHHARQGGTNGELWPVAESVTA